MSTFHVSAVPTTPPTTNRPTANFPPNLWGNRFLNYASDFKTIDLATKELYEELKEEVRRMIMATVDKSVKKLDLIDTVQRLGVGYLFENEIEDELEKMHNIDDQDIDDLYTVSLHFRLLRQQGIKISCDVFEKFKDDESKFKTSLINDIRGMLCLYEAAHLRICGEDTLDEAIDFTITHLKSVISHQSQVGPHLTEKISHALNRPLRKSLPRLEARYFMSIYPGEDLHNNTVLKFAKLDFKILQAVHQNEVSSLTSWWKNLDFTTKVPYARDRLVELYFWILGVYFEPQYALGRIFLTKVIYIISIIDDTYDAYGSFDELKLFTEATKRWNTSAIDILPDYMKIIYKTLLDIYNEIDEELVNEGSLYCKLVHYAKESMKKCIEAYFREATWCSQSYVPTYDEYMVVSLVTSGYPMLTTNSFLGMGDIVTKETFDWLSSNPKIIIASSIIGRLMDDKSSNEFEQKRGHVASAVECYIKQHGASKEEVVKVFQKEVENAWKDINEEFLKSTIVPTPLLERVLNLARVIDLLYKGGIDAYTNPKLMKDHIASLLIDSVIF